MDATSESAGLVFWTIEKQLREFADRLDKANIGISNSIRRMEQSWLQPWKDCAMELDREISPMLDELTKISAGLR